jgi:urease accessory protein
MATTTETAIEPLNLLHLLAVMSPAFPVGSFAYSHGLEWAIDAGDVADAEDVRQWIESLLVQGSGWNDAVLFAAAYDASDAMRLEIDELALALAASRERALETSDMGKSCAKAMATLHAGEAVKFQTYPVVLAATCAKSRISKQAALLSLMQAFSNNLIAVAVRLVPLGQTKGLEIMRELMPLVISAAEQVMSSKLDDLGSSTFLSDIAAMKHETQYSRVFRS